MKLTLTLLAALLLVPLTVLHAGELNLAAMFSDHMILQHDQPVPVWGWATPGEEVTVEFAGQKKTTTAGAGGKWLVKLDPLKVNAEPRDLKVNGLVIHDVLVGDVWLCSGQSNMAMTIDGRTGWLYIGGVANAKEEVRNSANPLLRQFYVDWKTDTKPQEQCTGNWTVAGPDTTANFTATGYFFARELQRRLRIPIGIINASFGGSSVEGWTSREALTKESDAEFVAKMNKLLDDYDNHDLLVTNYVAALAKWETKYDRADPAATTADAWAAPAADTADWKTVMLPATLAKMGLADGGVVWLRREIEVSAEFGTAWRLDFPASRAFCAVYLNGVKIFETPTANLLGAGTSRLSFPKGVGRPGRNTLAIRVRGYTGAGGITGGAFSVVPFNPKFQAVSLNGEWRCKAEKIFAPLPKDAEPLPVAPVRGVLHWMPVPSQYNAMLHPLIPFAIKGAAWYQGESNVGNPRYAQHLRILINDWRRRWGIGDFPFYLCQLPGFGARTNLLVESAWAECREAQTAALALPNTGMANLIDTCEDGDLHPLNKQDAGYRLALVALANTYGFKDLAWSGPVFDAMNIANGKAIITFKHAADGLVARPLPATYHPNLRKPELPPRPLELPSPGSELQGFTICDATRRWVNAQAKIEGTTVVVWSDEVKQPIAVRYAWADHPVCNLYNKAGLPAFPFRTDQFPGRGEKNK